MWETIAVWMSAVSCRWMIVREIERLALNEFVVERIAPIG